MKIYILTAYDEDYEVIDQVFFTSKIKARKSYDSFMDYYVINGDAIKATIKDVEVTKTTLEYI